jgi:hypothetical protein
MSIGRNLLVALASVVLVTSASAFIPAIGPADADRALRIARSSLVQREAFSARYNIDVVAPTVDLATLQRIEIVTEFRRMERIAEERLAVDHTFGAGGTNELMAALRPWRNQLTVIGHFRLGHVLLGATSPLVRIAIDDQVPLRTSIHLLGGAEGPPTGEIVEATFDSTRIKSAVHTISVWCAGAEVARQELDLAGLE